MILSFNVLSNGEIKSEIYQFNGVSAEILDQLILISKSILISSSDLISPNSHLFNYLDENKIVRFVVLDTDIESYIQQYSEIEYIKLN
jgi:hypothetical protein